VIVHNLGAEPCEIKSKPELGDRNDRWLINLLSDEHSEADSSGKHCVLLEPYDYRWYRAGSLNYVGKRTDV